MTPPPLAGLLLLGALTVFWGGNWPAMKLALRELDPWTFRTVCLLAGGGGLLALVRAGGLRLSVPREDRASLCLVTLFNITAWHLLSAYGLTLIGAGRAAIIAYTMPLWTVVFGWLLLRERLTAPRLLALALGLAGLAVLLLPEAARLAAAPAGVLFMLGAAAMWAVGTVLIKARRWRMPTAVLTGWQLVLGAVPIVAGAAVLGRAPSPATLAGATLAGVAYATVVGVIFCHWAWFKVVEILPATVATIGTLGVPVVGVLSSALVLGEPVGTGEGIALVLVGAGLAVLVSGGGQPAPPAAESPRRAAPSHR